MLTVLSYLTLVVLQINVVCGALKEQVESLRLQVAQLTCESTQHMDRIHLMEIDNIHCQSEVDVLRGQMRELIREGE